MTTVEVSLVARKNPRHMPHFAAGARLRLAIEVQAGAGLSKDLGPSVHFLADEIVHFDGCTMPRRHAERPACNRSDVLFELRGDGAVQCPMSGIMNPWGDLVDLDRLHQ